jgi:nucleolar protein 4
MQRIQIGGRIVMIDEALAREDLPVSMKKEVDQRDKRNLYLAKEGAILPETHPKECETMSKSDIERREAWYKAKMKNLAANSNLHISRTRVKWGNLPHGVTEEQLAEVIKKEAPPRCKVKQIKLLSKDGRSMGYAFVEFADHNDALEFLRNVNNNPKYFSKSRRSILEFAVEDMRKVMLLKKHMEAGKRGAQQEEEEQAPQQVLSSRFGSKRPTSDRSGRGESSGKQQAGRPAKRRRTDDHTSAAQSPRKQTAGPEQIGRKERKKSKVASSESKNPAQPAEPAVDYKSLFA